MSSYNLFKEKKFLPLFLTQFQEALTDNLIKNALIIMAVYDVYAANPDASNTVVALAGALLMLPYFIFSALSGQIADKFDKSVITRFIKGFEIFSMMLAVYGFYTENITILLVTVFLLGLHSTFFGPIKYSILPQHLNDNELIAGNAFIEGGTFIAILIGGILGTEMPGFLSSVSISAGAVYVALLGVILACCGFVISFYIPAAPSQEPELKIDLNIFKSTKQIIGNSRQNKRVFRAILGVSWFWLIGMVIMTLLPNFVKTTLNAQNSVFTLFLVVFSVGIAIGSLICEHVQKDYIDTRYVPVGALGMSVFLVIMFLLTVNYTSNALPGTVCSLSVFLQSAYNWVIIIDVLMIALFGGFYIVPLNTVIQFWSDRKHMSRTIAANNIINSLFMVVGAVVFVFCIKIKISIPFVVIILGILNFMVTIYICKILPEAILKVNLEWLLKLLYKVKVEGMDNYNKAGDRVLIIANHTSFIDGLLLAVFLPQKALFAINTEFSKKWWIKLIDPIVNFYPVDPMNPSATKSLIKEIRNDKHCVIFPEGRLTVTGAIMKVYEGPGMIAEKSGANILPIRIKGASYTPFSRLKGKVYIRLFPKITITILPYCKFEVDESLSVRARRNQAAVKLYDIMTEMMFDSSNIHEKIFQSLIQAKKLHAGTHKILEDINRKPITYRTLIRNSFIMGGHINKQVKKEQNIGILLPNTVASVTTFMALQSYGKTPVFLNFSSGIKNIVHACNISQVKYVYTSKVFICKAGLKDVIQALGKSNIKIIILENIVEKISKLTKIKGILYSLFPLFSFKKLTKNVTPDDKAVVLFTSGSEGKPKGVVLSHVNLQANRFQISSKVDFNDRDTIFNTLPLFHSFGLTGGTLLPLFAGVKVFLYPSPLHYKIISELVYDTNGTILFGTDTFLYNYAKVAHPYDFYSVRHVFAGAEKLKDITQDLWNHKFGIRIFEGYGATETSPILATNTPMENKRGSVGKLLSRIEYKLEPVPGVSEGGRLHVKGPNIMLGYYLTDSEGQIVEPENGWYDTGDIVKLDKEGYVYILGRAKRFAKIAGEMVSLSQVELEINKISPEKLHAVVAVPDDRKGEQLVLVSEDNNIDKNLVLTHYKEQGLSELAVPKSIIHTDKIPILGTGKVDYAQIIKKVNNHE
ncbi:MAG TPA: acyl-[ACP]--phospholipid O-acyltransferase [Victivallales bacterium]|nr:acyl-[ACP]--phospholipid O-acyltransferase [Victivallales bacterium]